MTQTASNMDSRKWLSVLCGAGLLLSFFLPWVIWDGSKVSGLAMATGDFFKISETRFGLGSPFPKLDFTFFIFWLIPVFAAVIIFLVVTNRKAGWLPFITGALSLSLLTVYVLFTKTLIDLGAGKNVLQMLTVFAWLHAVAAIGLILTIPSPISLLKKTGWLLVGPVFAYTSFILIQHYLEKQTFGDTATINADYTISADELIREFITNDTAANKKYLEKVIIVNGKVSTAEILADSTSAVKFADSTGSYAIFSLEKDQLELVKNINPGDAVSVKGVCSGSIFSEILGTTSISFKRTTLIKK